MNNSIANIIKDVPEFQVMVEKAQERTVGKPIRVAIAAADSENILKGVFMAQEDGFVEPILVGSYRKINEVLEKIGAKDRKYDIHPLDNDTNKVQYSIDMIKSGNADMLMRGNTQTRDFLPDQRLPASCPAQDQPPDPPRQDPDPCRHAQDSDLP